MQANAAFDAAASAEAGSSSLVEKQQVIIGALSSPRFPSQSSISSLLKLLSFSPVHLPLGLQLHSLSLKLSLSSLPFPASSLIRFYSKHRLPSLSLSAFLDIPRPDPACFSALISALSQNHLPSLSLSFFRHMLSAGLPSSSHALSSALRSSALSAAFDHTRALHAHALSSGLLPSPFVASALVHSYAKSGALPDARRTFRDLPRPNLVAWNALLSAHAHQGDAASAKHLFAQMCGQGNVAPDEYTFLAVLAACGNSGGAAAAAEETGSWLSAMRPVYGVEPGIEHYSCLLAAMARAGRVEEAERFAGAMPFEPDAAVWRTVLSAAVVHRRAGVGRRAAGRLLELDPRDDSAYVMLAKIGAFAGRKGEEAEAWVRMRDRGVRKEGGRSWIEVRGKVHAFVAGDRRHRSSPEIYAMVRELEGEKGLGTAEEELEEDMSYVIM